MSGFEATRARSAVEPLLLDAIDLPSSGDIACSAQVDCPFLCGKIKCDLLDISNANHVVALGDRAPVLIA